MLVVLAVSCDAPGAVVERGGHTHTAAGAAGGRSEATDGHVAPQPEHDHPPEGAIRPSGTSDGPDFDGGGVDAPDFGVEPSDSRAAPRPGRPARVLLPTIGVDAAVIGLDLRADGTIEVPADGTVAGWYRSGSRAGEPGPTVLGAHVDWDGRPGVFAELDAVSVGDLITVDDHTGAATTYRVDRVEQHRKDAFPTFAVYGATAEDTLRLVTCAGPFDRDRRRHRDNLVVLATAVDRPPAQIDARGTGGTTSRAGSAPMRPAQTER